MTEGKRRISREYPLLILGGGALAAECYAPAIMRLGWHDRVEVADSSARSLELLRSRYPELRTRCCDYRELLAGGIDQAQYSGAVISLPNHLHEDSVSRCMGLGLDVLCEKPLALDAATCRRLREVAAASHRQLGVAMVRRLIPSVRAIRTMIVDGLLGEIKNVRIQHGGAFQWPSDSGSYFVRATGGIWVNMGSHYVDMVQSWLGPLKVIDYRDDFAGGVEVNCKAILESPSGAVIDLRLSWTHALANKIVIEGSDGEIRTGVEDDSVVWSPAKLAVEGVIRSKDAVRKERSPADFISCFAEQFEQFGAVVEGTAPPAVTVSDAIATHETIDEGYRQRKPLFSSRPSPPARGRPVLAPARAVVTGGSGFLGAALVGRLAELDFDEITLPVRSMRSGATAARFPVSRVVTDLRDYGSVRDALAGSKYVFHLAYGASGLDAPLVTIEGTKNVVDAAIEIGAEVVVVVSTATVFGFPKTERPIDESFPYQPALGDYGRSKAAAEKYALAKANASRSTRIVVINPAAIYGPGGRQFTTLPLLLFQAGQFCWIEEGRGSFNYTFVDNVVDSLLLAAGEPNAHGQNFIICDGNCTVREFLSKLLGSAAESLASFTRQELIGFEREARPRFRELAGAIANDDVMRIINSLPVLPAVKRTIERRMPAVYARLQTTRRRAGVRTTGTTRTPPKRASGASWLADLFGPQQIRYSSERARKVLGWDPLVNLDEGQASSIEWLEAIGIVQDSHRYASATKAHS